MGQDVQITFNEMLNELNIKHEEYMKVVRTTIGRPKLFLQCQPCEIKINKCMKHCPKF